MDIQQTIQKFSTELGSGLTRPTVTAELANGRARLSAGPFNWDADLPAVVGGGNQAPSPTAYLLGALAGCAVAFLNDTLAPEFGVHVNALRATVACSADLAGLVGVPGAAPDLGELTLDVELDSPSPAARVHAMQQAWLQRCPIFLALLKPQEVAVNFRGPAAGSA
jgi:uncharacterized OsmC-like protein